MRRLARRPPFSLLLLGWIIFAFGVLWDLIYHAALLLVTTSLPSSLDLLGSFGHVITFVGIVVIIYALLRRHAR
jgi:hypothetical protein